MPLIGRRDGAESGLGRSGAPDYENSFSARGGEGARPFCDASQLAGAQRTPTSELPNRGRRSVRRAILVRHSTLAIDRHHGQVGVGIVRGVASGAFADLEIDDVLAGFVDEAMGVAASRLEAGTCRG
jgi:hypothetical protein